MHYWVCHRMLSQCSVMSGHRAQTFQDVFFAEGYGVMTQCLTLKTSQCAPAWCNTHTQLTDRSPVARSLERKPTLRESVAQSQALLSAVAPVWLLCFIKSSGLA